MKVLYTAKASSDGPRQGHARTSDGQLDLEIAVPEELGGPGGGTNPEQLFAAGYSTCFHSALYNVAGRLGLDPSDSIVTVSVGLGAIGGRRFGLEAEIDVELPKVDGEEARQLVAKAHEVCPYSNATRGNIEVGLLVEGQPIDAAEEPASAGSS